MTSKDSSGLLNSYQVIIGRDTFKDIEDLSGLKLSVGVKQLPDAGSADGSKNVRGEIQNSGELEIHIRSTSREVDLLWQWFESTLDPNTTLDQRNGRVELIDINNGKAYAVWKLTNLWPCRWDGPSLNKKNGGVAQERIVLSFETIIRLKGQQK